MSTSACSRTVVPAGGASAGATATATGATTWNRLGETLTAVRPTVSVTGVRYACTTAAVAWSAVIPPTETGPIETPSATVVTAGVDVSADAVAAPAHRVQTRATRRMEPARLTVAASARGVADRH